MEFTESFFERCRPLLRLQVLRLQLDPRLQRRFDSSDLVQETLVRAVGRLEQFRGSTEGEAIRWLQRVLRSVVANKVDEARAAARDVARELPLDDWAANSSQRIEAYLSAATPSPADNVERAELLIRLAEGIDGLPEDQRNVVSLRDLHGYRIDEIATLLGKTEKSVAGLLLRGRLALRAFAQEIGLEPP